MAVGLESLPLGFRFRPTDQELVNYYLKGKIEGRMESDAVIPEVDVCKCEPWDLPDKSLIKSEDPEWFFFSPKDRKYPNGPRANRATEAGYWKATGKDRTIKSRLPQPTVIGKKKTLVFYRGRAPKAVRTNWVMHEYSIAESEPKGGQTGFVLYRLFKKPEENYQSSNADEIGRSMNELENSRSSPTSTRFSPVEDQTGAEEEFAATLNHNLPESELQQNLQSVPDSYAYQTTDTDRLLEDIGDSARMFPVRPGENHSNSNMTYNIGEPEEEVTEQDGCHLNEFAQFLGQEYAQVGSYELPRIDSPWLDYSWFSSYGVGEQFLNTYLTQDNTLQQDLVTELLDAVLSNEEVDSHGALNNQTHVVSTALPEGQPCMIIDNFIKESEMGGNIDIGSLISQGCGNNMFVGGSTEDSCHHETTRQLEFVGTGNSNNFSDSMEESTSQVNFDRRITEIRKHEHLPAIDNLVAQQGSAVRRLRLQNCIQVGTESTKDHWSSKELEKEGEEYIENCNAEERNLLGSPLDTVEGIYSHDGVAIPASSETSDGCKPMLRMRRNRLTRDVDEVKGSSSQLVKPRSPSPYVIRIGVLFSAILLFLCLGISWYISSRYAI